MRIIFCDVNGVLDSVRSAIANHHLKPAVGTLNLDIEERGLDRTCVGLLKALCTELNASIVVTSVWRKNKDIDHLRRIFAHYGWLDVPIVGCTIVGSQWGWCRGDEISQYVNSQMVDEYAILDDDSDMLPDQRSKFVHVSNVNGLSPEHYCKVLRVFNQPDLRLEQQVYFKRRGDCNEQSNS